MNSPSPKLAANASPSERSPLTAPAGRSPPRRKSLKTFAAARSPVPSPKRFGPSRILAQHNAPRVPFSVTTALNGTFSYSSTIPKQSSTLNPASNRRQKPKPLRSVSKRSGAWDFEIHADTCEEEITNLMQHSTSILDISDDGERERRRSAKGKENIPPASEGQSMEQEYTGPVTRSRANASKNFTMTDRSRVVLGELNPSDFATEEQLQSDSEHDSSDAGNNENDAREGPENILAVIPEKDESEKIGEQVSQSLEDETASKSRPLTRRLTRAAAAAAAAAAEPQHNKGEGEEESTKPSFKIFDESIAERAASD
ncbi:hypothetical protein KEM56_002357 [Ascosphaera pollenicola]|nr:hypothetical protein KEM56_002357 [Ascosphaera pollenicola]